MTLTEVLLIAVLVLALALWIQRVILRRKIERLARERAEGAAAAAATIWDLEAEITSLSPYREVRDAAAEAARMRREAEATLDSAKAGAEQRFLYADAEIAELKKKMTADAKAKEEKAEFILANANRHADSILADARAQAEKIGGDAYRALENVEELKRVAKAMENVIEGYGDRYMKPTFSLLDELAETYGFAEAGAHLKQARELSKLMVSERRAATCEYVEAYRRDTAIHFVTDAFNGKVDSILSRVKSDNHGKLEQEIRDAFALVNRNGAAFRDARITDEYLNARLSELKWAASVHALKEREREEQRRIKEQIREEERARREIEKALRDGAKEEETLQKAMEKIQAQAAKATEEQRVQFELRLAELQTKLAEAEAKNQRALSMAQQTRAGHVYVISNIGSFGERMFKVGMTRRLEPSDRIRELGDASVPFPFDVHAMIWCDDAPALETRLHRTLLRCQVNKVNPRKEFFRVDLETLRREVDGACGSVSWTIAAEAIEYRETLAIEEKLRTDSPEARDWERQQLAFEVANEIMPEPESVET
jgi:hypothetical protein